MGCFPTLTLLFFGFSLSFCSKFPPRTYYYVDKKMSWNDAQQYCREKYTDLATFESMDDISRLHSTFSYSWAWIGLRDDPESWKNTLGNDTNSWRWTITGEMSKTDYNNWYSTNPNNYGGNESCVAMDLGGKWFDKNCGESINFVCYNVTEQNKKNYMYISTTKTWPSAREYCIKHSMDLAVIENSEENAEVSSLKPNTTDIWIGLYRVPWTWSDKSQSSFKNWRSSSPNNYQGNQHCVVEDKLHEWDDDQCTMNYVFICHQVAKLRTTVKMKFVTDVDLTDSATNAQILEQLGVKLTSQGWTDFKLQWKIQPKKQEMY
ncbi:unnamed protein product [Oreochromis niloticus]|nr:unnamed protein product [Mustela putorius furo]